MGKIHGICRLFDYDFYPLRITIVYYIARTTGTVYLDRNNIS